MSDREMLNTSELFGQCIPLGLRDSNAYRLAHTFVVQSFSSHDRSPVLFCSLL